MLEELLLLFSHVTDTKAEYNDYIRAIKEDNCLGKRSGITRKLSVRHLRDLYSLDPSATIFRALRFFWERDSEGRPILSLLCAYSRDAILRMCTPFILRIDQGELVSREMLEKYIESKESDRFSKVTKTSIAKNVNSTWTKSGHLIGRVKKYRSEAQATAGSAAYALLLGYLGGVRGAALFETEYTKMLDCSADRLVDLAEDASRRGWITLKRLGNVIEVMFPKLLIAKERKWISEQ